MWPGPCLLDDDHDDDDDDACFGKCTRYVIPQKVVQAGFFCSSVRRLTVLLQSVYLLHVRDVRFFWVVMPCGLVSRYRRFGATYSLYLQA
jgi:hypothetical protein